MTRRLVAGRGLLCGLSGASPPPLPYITFVSSRGDAPPGDPPDPGRKPFPPDPLGPPDPPWETPCGVPGAVASGAPGAVLTRASARAVLASEGKWWLPISKRCMAAVIAATTSGLRWPRL